MDEKLLTLRKEIIELVTQGYNLSKIAEKMGIPTSKIKAVLGN